MDEQTLSKTPPTLLRLSHAEHFLTQYLMHSGPPIDSYWLMIGYFDAFLFSIVSVFDMAAKPVRKDLCDIQVFCFFKALRNITAHHSVLAATVAGNKFPRSFSRHLNVSFGGAPNDSSRLVLRLDVLREIFDAVEKEWPRAKKNIKLARSYIAQLESQRNDVFLEDLMSEAVTEVRAVVSHV